MSKNRTYIFAIGLAVAALAVGSLAGCATSQEIDRTHRRPHTAMRGPAFKRLIITYNEANNLAYRADRYAKALRDAGSVDPDTQLRAFELADDLASFADDIEWSLANLQRMTWHRTRMDEYWDEFLALYPEDESYHEAYTGGDMRKTSPKLKLKNQAEYAELHEYEHHDANWSTLLHPTGESVYHD
jgi:hypothetical protein